MRVIFHGSPDPYFNLAAEEWLLDNVPDDVFVLWRNDRSVIVGKNQNTWAEVDDAYVREAGIAVVRRLTGGGAVFHDPGNVNYTFITAGGGIDFARFTEPVIRALASLGVEASLSGRNDLVTADGAKISGSAACVRRTPFGERRLHHGTLLFDADLSEMARALTPDAEKLRTKAVASVKNRVANIKALSPELAAVDSAGFASMIADFAAAEFHATASDLTDTEREGIAALADSKYRTWEWNFGESPAFEAEKKRRFPYGTVEVGLRAEKGRIAELAVTGDFFSTEDVAALCERLRGARLEREALAPLLADVGRFIEGASPGEICDLICE